MSEAVVELAGVTKVYAGHVAVRSVSLSVPRGVIYGLLGPNGAGKTTSIRMVNDIVRPDEGTIVLFGGLAPGRASQPRIGYLPEERGLYPKMTVRRVLMFLAELRGLRRADVAPKIVRWIERFELGKWIDEKVEALSKGMQQKVQFIAAILHEPDLLILDEPFSGLDPINADVLRDVVKEQKAAGKTILLSTHLMEHAEQLCDAVCIIARGEKILEGTLAKVKASARDEKNAYRVELARRNDTSETSETMLRDASLPGALAMGATDDAWIFDMELAKGRDAGPLLQKLILAGEEIVRFERKVPTLHEIFIERVRKHEEARHAS